MHVETQFFWNLSLPHSLAPRVTCPRNLANRVRSLKRRLSIAELRVHPAEGARTGTWAHVRLEDLIAAADREFGAWRNEHRRPVDLSQLGGYGTGTPVLDGLQGAGPEHKDVHMPCMQLGQQLLLKGDLLEDISVHP